MRDFFKNGYSALKNLHNSLVDFIFPEPPVAKIVRNLTETEIADLPRAHTPPHDDIYSLWDYQNPVVKEIIWQIKFYENEELLTKIAPYLRDTIAHVMFEGELPASTAYLAIPVPISKERRAERGYNQTELITEAVCALFDTKDVLYAPNFLIKHIDTKHQTGTSRQSRLKSLAGTFSVRDKEALRGKYIILIDDVITTGATLKEAARALKKAGARDVFCLTLAH